MKKELQKNRVDKNDMLFNRFAIAQIINFLNVIIIIKSFKNREILVEGCKPGPATKAELQYN